MARSLSNRRDEETSVAGNAARLPGYFLIASDRTIVADDGAKGRYRAARGTSSAGRLRGLIGNGASRAIKTR